jgi:hypothetical protein
VADFVISLDMFEQSGAEPHDTENLINEAQRIEGILVSILCIEQEPGVVKASFRSKHDVDVAAWPRASAAAVTPGPPAARSRCRSKRPARQPATPCDGPWAVSGVN